MHRELGVYLGGHARARLIVTHAAEDVLAFADRIVAIEGGRVIQDARPDEITAQPRSRYVADLVGVNLFHGELTPSGLRTDGGVDVVAAEPDPGSGRGFATVHPRAVALHLERPEGSPRNTWTGRIAAIGSSGDTLRVRVDGALSIVAEVTPAAVSSLSLREGLAVYATVKATEVHVYPA